MMIQHRQGHRFVIIICLQEKKKCFFLYHLKQQGAIIEFFSCFDFLGGYFLEGRVRDEGVTFLFFSNSRFFFRLLLLLFFKEQAGSS